MKVTSIKAACSQSRARTVFPNRKLFSSQQDSDSKPVLAEEAVSDDKSATEELKHQLLTGLAKTVFIILIKQTDFHKKHTFLFSIVFL